MTTQDTSLVERLRKEAAYFATDSGPDPEADYGTFKLLNEAADRIHELETRCAALLRQAEQWELEASAHKASLHEAYQLLTGATGEPGNWNGARPIKAYLEADRDAFMAWIRAWCKHRFGVWITHNTAKGAFMNFAAERKQVALQVLARSKP